MSDHPLSLVRVVLFEPLDPVNIGAVVRAMKNMGVADLRLVRPAPYDPSMLERVAHGTRDLVARIRHVESLDEALADCVRVAGFTARRRAAKWRTSTPREAAPELLRAAEEGPVALLFGREDTGLPNEALDRASLVVTIPTTEHASLNLAQAVLVGLYELHVAAPAASRTLAPPRKDAPAATAEQFEQLFADVERALAALDFFRTRNPELILRTVRSLAFRAAPDAREIELVRAMSREVLRALDRSRAGARP
ncbi:MAG TPA: TrmJ/YjtD family RNA methyltransferase [Gemmatimonadaceae bacterium]